MNEKGFVDYSAWMTFLAMGILVLFLGCLLGGGIAFCAAKFIFKLSPWYSIGTGAVVTIILAELLYRYCRK